ncbi:bifunctional YgfZ-GcvT conserved site/YgfZ-GcvT/GTP-binding protein TrmE-Aminomethyltransferase GcvT [Babesia duncani]|uniref:Bifunctional YgfZ-GcvT conserved site/YgfZ-GcvT/GTP-binding protein TrmE-Aminomethyltransferase GcvT n=1 Tax=Babesia duncani TaxID=323732 RepID=A0AAD9PMF3_9APIC|nr:bifunctional YgfZ-GcvT conserved site/YgfZ-GcvT/GTP-binding protein TrmE-Aminomethyltransferase GcvT [Babesia duncani]
MGFIRLCSRKILSLVGSDSVKFLQGLITNDIQRIESVPKGEYVMPNVLPSLFLASNGRVEAEALVFKHDHALMLDTDSTSAERILNIFQRRKLSAQVEFSILNNANVYATFTGVSANKCDSKESPHFNVNTVKYMDPRIRSIKSQRMYEFAEVPKDFGVENDYELALAIEGLVSHVNWPSLSLMPQDLNFQHFGYISNQKGCYVGQEFMNRIANRTLINKYHLCFVFNKHLFEPLDSEVPEAPDCAATRAIANQLGMDPKPVLARICNSNARKLEAQCSDLITLIYCNSGFGLSLVPRKQFKHVTINGQQHLIALAHT